MSTMTPREHIENIRQTKFSIRGELNPLTEDLHQAVKNLADELYAEDVHFFMELVQSELSLGFLHHTKKDGVSIKFSDVVFTGIGRPKISFSKVAAQKINKNFETSDPRGHDKTKHILTRPIF